MIKVLIFFLPLALFFQTGAFAQNEAMAGTVISTLGKVTAMGADNAERVLARGGQVFEKDTIVVGDASKVQIRFTDGGLLNLIEKTDYKISVYSYNNTGRKNESVGDLLKGGFRSLSGGVSKTGANAASVNTPAGTMGVLGTLMSANIVKGMVYFGCDKGSVSLGKTLSLSLKVVDKGVNFLVIGPEQSTRFASSGSLHLPFQALSGPP